jgi:hypothetical protein
MASAQNKNKIFAELAKNASTISNRQENSRKNYLLASQT